MVSLAGQRWKETRIASVTFSVRLTGEDVERLLRDLFLEEIKRTMPEGSVPGRVLMNCCGAFPAITLHCEVVEG